MGLDSLVQRTVRNFSSYFRRCLRSRVGFGGGGLMGYRGLIIK